LGAIQVVLDKVASITPADTSPIQGELQAQIMPVMWSLGSATVEQVRRGLPRRYRGAYTTVQTVLNRLAERGLLERERSGNLIVYRPRTDSNARRLGRRVAEQIQTLRADSRVCWLPCQWETRGL